MTTEDFYVVLPSNVELKSSEVNTPSNYLTELGIPIDLKSESDKWVVGLVEMSFVNSLKTIDKEGVLVKVTQTREASHYHLYKFSPEILSKMTSLHVAEWQFDAIELTDGTIFNLGGVFFKYNANDRRFTLSTSSMHFYKYTIDNMLASLMGFHPQVYNVDWITRVLYTPDYVEKWARTIQSTEQMWKAPHEPSLHIEGGKHYLVIASSDRGVAKMFPDNRKAVQERKVTTSWVINLSFTIPPGCYKTPQELVAIINQTDLQRQTQVTISFDENINRFTWNILNPNVTLVHTNQLESVLGFEEKIISKSTTAIHPPRLQMGIDNLHVYCDVCSEMFVGNTLKPLLRIVNMPKSRLGESVNVLFNKPIYVPCMKRSIDTIRIQIYDNSDNDSTGQIVPFSEGKTVVTLHFRKRL